MNDMVRMVVVLSLICGLSGLTLASVRKATAPVIEEQVLTHVQGPALKQIFPSHDNNPVRDRKRMDLGDGRSLTVFPAFRNGKLTGVAFETFGKGYGGPIGIMVGFATDGSRLEGIGVTTLKETPGLGARIVEPEFRDQFTNHSMESIALTKQGGDINAVAGATISSTGTVAAVNQAVNIFRRIKDRISAEWES